MKDYEKFLERIEKSALELEDLAMEELQADRDGFLSFLLTCINSIPEEKLEPLLKGVAKSGDTSALEELGPLLDGESVKRTDVILRIWASFPDDRFMPYLDRLAESNNSRIRANIVEILEKFPGGISLDILRKLLLDEDNRVKANAALSLWKQGLDEGFALLKRMLKSPDIWTRASASFAISSIADPDFLDVLIAACNDESASVREKSIIALSNINSSKALPVLKRIALDAQEHDFIVASAIRAYTRINEGRQDEAMAGVIEKRGLDLEFREFFDDNEVQI